MSTANEEPTLFSTVPDQDESSANAPLSEAMTDAQLARVSQMLRKTVVEDHRATVIKDFEPTKSTGLKKRATDAVQKHKIKLYPMDATHWIDSEQAAATFAVLVLTNIILLGVQADLPVPEADFQDKAFLFWFIVESMFNLAFVGEVALHLKKDGVAYFFEVSHFFDLLIVLLSVFDTWIIGLMIAVSGGMSYRFISVFRVLRLMRVMRVFRLFRFCQTLWVVIHTLLGALTALKWIVLLMILVCYTTAVTMRLTLGVSMHDKLEGEELTTAKERWGSVLQSMFTLFVCMTGEAWYDIALDAILVERWMYAIFIPFMCIANFLLVNLFIGIMCEKVSEERDKAAKLATQRADEEMVEHLAEIFVTLDTDVSESVTVEELGEALKSNQVKARFDDLQISLTTNPHALMRFFHTHETSEGMAIHFEDFVNGCMCLRNSEMETKIWFLEDEVRQCCHDILDAVALCGKSSATVDGNAHFLRRDKDLAPPVGSGQAQEATGPTDEFAMAFERVLETRLSEKMGEIKRSLTEDFTRILKDAMAHEASRVQSHLDAEKQEAELEPVVDSSQQWPADPEAKDEPEPHVINAEQTIQTWGDTNKLDESSVAAFGGEETLPAPAASPEIEVPTPAPPQEVEAFEGTEARRNSIQTTPANRQPKILRSATRSGKDDKGRRQRKAPPRQEAVPAELERTAPDGQAEEWTKTAQFRTESEHRAAAPAAGGSTTTGSSDPSLRGHSEGLMRRGTQKARAAGNWALARQATQKVPAEWRADESDPPRADQERQRSDARR